ncbi:uncharacterized protein LOC129909559 [Episyrphus balteatus]|uniref:uncharacterized protein LOC129909559 n=1 Tax=Episyrphus balteatus TaxID=286459 RepID=UPI002485DC90|nr:uncharacterized protein LOC129909559 [Episyrphus balteatus]
MEEKALIINIATILAKDIAFDQKNNFKCPVPSYPPGKPPPLLQSDDEAFDFFLRHHVQKSTSAGSSNSKRKYPSEEKQIDTRSTKIAKPKDDPTPGRINLIQDLTVDVFESNLHLNKNTFQQLYNSIKGLIKPLHTNNTVISNQTIFSLGLWKLATDEHFEEISRRFKIPLQACHLIIRSFWGVISDNNETFIKWPRTQTAQKLHMTTFQKNENLQHFRHLFGLVSIKRLDIFLESEDEETSVILQIICDGKQRIIDSFVDFATNYSFVESPIGQSLERDGAGVPRGCYLIGGNNFPLKPYLIRPFELECFRDESRFNELLRKAQAISDSVLHKMMRRFNTLYALEAKDMSEVRKVLQTICSLHNMCQEFGDECIPNCWERSEKCILASKVNENNQGGRKRRLEVMEEIVSI